MTDEARLACPHGVPLQGHFVPCTLCVVHSPTPFAPGVSKPGALTGTRDDRRSRLSSDPAGVSTGFTAATVAALVESIRLRCDDQTFAIVAYPQSQLFQPVSYDRTLPGSEALRPRSLATDFCYVGRSLYRMSNFGVWMVADSAFALIASGLVAQEVQRQMDGYDSRYPKTTGLYEPQSY